MGKVIYFIMATLDGFMEGLDREIDWAIIDEELHQYVNHQQNEIGAYLYGRRMYEVMADYWPTADLNPSAPAFEVEFARIWKNMPKIVFSKTLQGVEGDARLVREVTAEEIMKLKEQSSKNLLLGGANIAATFMRLGLVDEIQLFIHPVVLGNGTPAFPVLEGKLDLHLAETLAFSSGVVYMRYQVENKS